MATRILVGDAREKLQELPPDSVHVCGTSPPYLAVRDYGVPPSIWGGSDPACAHDWGDGVLPAARGGQTDYAETGLRRDGRTEAARVATAAKAKPRGQKPTALSWTCKLCGAWKGALGLEPTPEMFIDHLVEVFREVKRVLRPDGTLWVNIGDTYTRDGAKAADERFSCEAAESSLVGSSDGGLRRADRPGFRVMGEGLKPKDLIGVPWMLAFALRRDGWWLRQDVIWHKPAPMPESADDRCTKAHEYLFLLSKSETYFFDNEAIKEPAIYGPDSGRTGREKGAFDGKRADVADDSMVQQSFRAIRATRNKRSVWTIPPEPYLKAHFATFPPALIEPCILAGSSERGACPKCRSPWYRITAPTERYAQFLGKSSHDHEDDVAGGMMQHRGQNRQNAMRDAIGVQAKETETLGWYPSCRCDGLKKLPKLPPSPRLKRAEDQEDDEPTEVEKAELEARRVEWRKACRVVYEQWRELCASSADLPTVPCVVLDPFGGSGTTGMVADRRGRDGIIIELKPDYAEMARERIEGDGGLFSKVAAE